MINPIPPLFGRTRRAILRDLVDASPRSVDLLSCRRYTGWCGFWASLLLLHLEHIDCAMSRDDSYFATVTPAGRRALFALEMRYRED